jgi:hypothetical protein
VDSEVWYAELQVRRRKRAPKDDAIAKPGGAPTSDELAYWLKEFSGAEGAKPENDSPFPPGYGEDIEAE